MLGFKFAPRLADIGDKRLYVGSQTKTQIYPQLAPLVDSNRLNLSAVEPVWEDLLRLVSSVQTGQVKASLILNKLAAYPRQHRLAQGLRELGRLEKTLFVLEWMRDLVLRERVNRGLVRGESRNSLARTLFYHRLGEVRERRWEEQLARASGLTLLCALIGTWNTLYLPKAVVELRRQDYQIADEDLRSVSPLGWEHLVLTGYYPWDKEVEYDQTKMRPLRQPFVS